MKTLFAILCCIGWVVTTPSQAAPPKEGREILAKHQTVAQFEGVAYQQCRGLTALCPDKCGNSGNFATFRIVKYIAYEKLGEYGDPKQDRFVFQVDDNMKNLKVPEATREAVTGLKKGDFVLLDWQHDYVTKDGSSSPERPLKKLEPITREQAEKLTGWQNSAPGAAQKTADVNASALSKIKFRLEEIRGDGLRGPGDGLVAVSYEFCVPAQEATYAEVRKIDPNIKVSPGSRGRIGCQPDQALCTGSTHQSNWRQVLTSLASLKYIEEIRECFYE